jgi:signal transduction histidine kinase/CheY-like chemotaxis protein
MLPSFGEQEFMSNIASGEVAKHRLTPQNFDMVRAEQVAGVFRSAIPGALGSMFAALILSSMLYVAGSASLLAVLIFNTIISVNSVARLFMVRAYFRKPRALDEWRRWGRYAMLTALIGGIGWGMTSFLLMDPADPGRQFIVVLCCAGLAAGSITAFGTYLPSYYCSLFPMMVPTVIWATLYGDALHWTYAVLCSLWIVIMALLARAFSDILVTSLCLQFENLALANDAEEANKAKSRFLAAASHDLRQPVHALEMFVGALRLQKMAPEGGQLVRQIQNSVDSLEGLFNSILDISRLDAGLVEVRARTFAISPLLERICTDERAAAAGKEIELRLVPCSAIVRTDPVLLERVLRNLVSNAVRYTERGCVLVGCRLGARLSIEVRDTGPGIAESERELIFQEFYQIENAERDRKQGLGLGLAIVRRLCGVLKTPLSFETVTGKGSVFRVSVPLVNSVAPLPHPVQALEKSEHSQESLFIIVIDDEAEIQSAMSALLTAWGHDTLIAGSGEEAALKTSQGMRVPDLIISDYRLRRGENGLNAVSRLRGQFEKVIPAILITGDTAPDRLREAAAGGCFLMHKPIANARLRAAINNLTKIEN